MKPEGEDLERLDRMATLGELLAEVAHEVRNPLVSMKTFLQLLPDHVDDEEFTGDFRKVVLDELSRMERLLDTVLQQARPDTTRIAEVPGLATCNLESAFGALTRLLEKRAEERDVKLSLSIAPALPDIAIAEDRLRQVVLNLVLNALDASPPSSCITLRAHATREQVAFSVEDQGPGIPAVLRGQLFEPFFTTRPDGAGGLGLAIAKQLVEEAGGEIGIDSTYADGARFHVSLPHAGSG